MQYLLHVESQAGDKIINPFSDNDIAFYQDDEASDTKQGIAYKCKDLIEIMSKNTPIDEYDLWKLCAESVVGFIRIIESREPCHGAWEVTRSAGPGYGKLVYAMGYDFNKMSNNHDQIVKYIQQHFNISKDQFNESTKNDGEAFFQKHYS